MFNSLTGDPSGIGNQLFQFAAQNNAANIDWAQLARFWIAQNSDTTPPPPPNISDFQMNAKRANFEEKGEADMEMDENEEVPPAPPMLTKTDANIHAGGWFMHPSGSMDAWNTWPNTTNFTSKTENATAHIPSLMKITVPNPNEFSKTEYSTGSKDATVVATLDAAKRKVLPAWIREGLEKMEREKQKREQQQSKRLDSTSSDLCLSSKQMVKSKFQASDDDDSTDNEQDIMDKKLLKSSSQNCVKHIQHGNNDIDEDDALEDRTAPADLGKNYEQKLTELMVAVRRTLTELLLEVTNDEIARIAQETIASRKLKASSALVVRKSALTSITSKLGLAAYSSSGESGNDSDENSASDDGSEQRRRVGSVNSTGEDSEEEIKSNLRLRRRAFEKVTDEIEERVAANAAREEQKLNYYKEKEQLQHQNLDKHDSEIEDNISTATGFCQSNQQQQKGKNYARDFGETTSDSKLQSSSNGKRTKERVSRFSDNKDSKSISTVTASYLTQLTAAATTKTAASTAAQKTPNPMPPYPITTTSLSKSVSTHMTDSLLNLQNYYTPTSAATASGISTMMNAADAALEKATAKVNSTAKSRERIRECDERHKQHHVSRDRETSRTGSHRRRRHSSDESDSTNSSSDTSSTSSQSSRHSKRSRTSSKSYSRQSSKHSSGSSSRRHHDTDDYKRTILSTSKTSKRSHYERDEQSNSRHRDRNRSRSRSNYSSSSSKRHRH